MAMKKICGIIVHKFKENTVDTYVTSSSQIE